MSAHDRFVDLIQGLFETKGAERLSVPGDGYLLRFDGRIFHLGLDSARNEIVISTQVYFSDETGGDVYPDLIADFNSHHLFNGGYRMGRDPETLYLYVSQRKSLTDLERSGLEDVLDDFISRCISCTRWYATEVEQRPPSDKALEHLDALHEQVDALVDAGLLDAS